MTHNSVNMTRILSEDVGAFDLFAPGMGYRRAQARNARTRGAAKFAALTLSILTACKALVGRMFA